MLGDRYEDALFGKLAAFRQLGGSKLVIALVSLPNFADDQATARVINRYNQADVLIVPNVTIGTLLRDHGLTVAHLVYLNLWDWPQGLPISSLPAFHQWVSLPSDQGDLATAAQQAGLPVKKLSGGQNGFDQSYFLHTAGGYGLIWSPGVMVVPDLGATTIMASGLPILINSDHPLAELVTTTGSGLTCDTLEDTAAQVRSLPAKRYQRLATRAAQLAAYIRRGGFTTHALTQVQTMLEELRIKEVSDHDQTDHE